MSKPQLVCLNCGNNKLEAYSYSTLVYYKKILKNGKVSDMMRMKEFPIQQLPDSEYQGVQCKTCGCVFDYHMDSKGKIDEIIERF